MDFVKLDLDPTTLPAPPPKASMVNTDAEYERREKLWRDPALNALGLPTGVPGIAAYVSKLMSGATWPAAPELPDTAYVVFVTKYMANWCAYADARSRMKVTIVYQWLADRTPTLRDGTGGFRNTGAMGWGEENFDRVFAHESAHIFGAPDEFARSKCCMADMAGHLQAQNSKRPRRVRHPS
jgi:hypothetical protein